MEAEIFEPKNPILRLVVEELEGKVLIDESQYRDAYNPETKTISGRKADSWFRKGLAVWRKGYAVLTEKGKQKADKVLFAV